MTLDCTRQQEDQSQTGSPVGLETRTSTQSPMRTMEKLVLLSPETLKQKASARQRGAQSCWWRLRSGLTHLHRQWLSDGHFTG